MLLTLPVELLAKVLKYLGWRDVLQVRVTCTYLAEISRTKDIWKHLVDEHIKADVLPPRLERPVSMHSSLELEHLLLRWKSADHALTSDTFQPARERTFMGVDPESLHLITGGRWLLVRNQKAGVTYYDLDSETISGVELIPEQLDGTLTCQVTMCIEHDMQSPFLGFLIALSLLGPSSEMDPTGFTKNWCHSQIWHVKAVLDNMQRVIGLTATLVASFPYREWIFGVYSLSLRGPNLAIHAYASYGSCAFVVNWRQANADPLKYTLRLVGGTILQMAKIFLLPRDLLLVVSNEDYLLCDYSSTPQITSLPDHPPSLFPHVWHVKGPQSLKASSFFFTETRACIVVRGVSSISAITFDFSSSSASAPPSVVDLAFLERKDSHYLSSHSIGSKRSFLINHHGEMKVISYPPSVMCEQPNHILHQHGLICKQPSGMGVVADDDIGRVVYLANNQPTEPTWTGPGLVFVVVDFARKLQQI